MNGYEFTVVMTFCFIFGFPTVYFWYLYLRDTFK